VLATLIAGDLKSLTLTSLSFRTTEVCTSCVAAGLTSLRVSQITFPIILLFPFRKHERSAALRTHYFKVWHTRFLHESEMRFSLSALRSAGVAFLSTTVVGRKRCFSQTLRRKPGVPTVCWAECTPAIQIFLRNSTEIYVEKCGRTSSTTPSLWQARNTRGPIPCNFTRHIGCTTILET
jgi:hypothetical protein